MVKGSGKIGPTGVDHITAATLQFENGIIAEIITAIECNIPGEVSIYGSEGIITIPNPWLPSSPCRGAKQPLPADTAFLPSTIILQARQKRTSSEASSEASSEIIVAADRDLFTYEADMVANHIEARQAPAMSWGDTLGNMRLLDRWREEIGVVYQQDQ